MLLATPGSLLPAATGEQSRDQVHQYSKSTHPVARMNCPKKMGIPIPKDPWEWYIYLHEWLKFLVFM